MKIKVDLNGFHYFEKQNFVTQFDKIGQYDIMKCSNCGISGKRRNFYEVEIEGKVNELKIRFCDGKRSFPKVIKITECFASGKAFENIKPNSRHKVINAPEGEYNDVKGVWVMGVGEPVKVLWNEFVVIKPITQ